MTAHRRHPSDSMVKPILDDDLRKKMQEEWRHNKIKERKNTLMVSSFDSKPIVNEVI